jgi:metal-responsive CopG/Arc/MetJ family transcriptional regulator
MELDELREELKRQRSDVMATMLRQKIVSQSTLHKLAVLQTAIEAVSAVIAAGGVREVETRRASADRPDSNFHAQLVITNDCG